MFVLVDQFKSKLEIVSLQFASKRFIREYGLRGEYFEFKNIDSFT